MQSENDQPAFPRSGDGCQPQSGLTIRDYFAAAALPGLLSAHGGSLGKKTIAKWAYESADAMLAVRENREGK